METFGLACFYGLTAVDDIRTKKVRNLEIIVFGIIGIVIDFVLKPYSLESILGGVAVGVVMYLFSVMTKEKIGKGDAWIVMVSGLYLGFIDTLMVVWLASILAVIYGLVATQGHEDGMDMEMPFVPFLLVSFLMEFTIGQLGGLILCG